MLNNIQKQTAADGKPPYAAVCRFRRQGSFFYSENHLESGGESEVICLHGGLRLCRLAGAAAPISDEWRKTLELILKFPYCIYAFRSILYAFRSLHPKITENLPIN